METRDLSSDPSGRKGTKTVITAGKDRTVNPELRSAIIQLLTALMQTRGNKIVINIEAEKTADDKGEVNFILQVDEQRLPLEATATGTSSALAYLMIAFMSVTSSGQEPLH